MNVASSHGSVPNLRGLRVADNPRKNWAGRISSIQVNFRPDYFRRGRELRWGRMEVPRSGACFYRGPGFQGDYFCVASGEGYDSLPPGFNDSISSIRILGNSEVVAFNDPGYTGIRIHLRNDVPDLRALANPGQSLQELGRPHLVDPRARQRLAGWPLGSRPRPRLRPPLVRFIDV